MDKAQVISKLREHEPELKAAGIAHVHLFGSTGRGEATPASDINLMIDFDESNPPEPDEPLASQEPTDGPPRPRRRHLLHRLDV